MIKLTAVLYLLLSSALAQQLSGIKASADSVELELLLEHLGSSNIGHQQAEKAVDSSIKINASLLKVSKSNHLFLIKSEIYKGLLNTQYLSSKEEIVINESVLKAIEKKLLKSSVVYSDFSNWIANSILSELAPYREDNFLNSYQSADRSDFKVMKRVHELQKTLKYLSPWILAIYEKSPESFNSLVSKVSVDILESIANKAELFQSHSELNNGDEQNTIIKVPDMSHLKKALPTPKSPSLDDKLKEEVQNSKNTVEALNEMPENPSEGIDKLMEKEELVPGKKVDKKQWTPK